MGERLAGPYDEASDLTNNVVLCLGCMGLEVIDRLLAASTERVPVIHDKAHGTPRLVGERRAISSDGPSNASQDDSRQVRQGWPPPEP